MKVRDQITDGFGRERLRLELRRSLSPVAVLMVAAMGGLAAGGYILSQLNISWPGSGPVEFRVTVDNAEGVVGGQHEVRVAGVTAGRIVDTRLRDGRAELRVSVDKEYAPIHRDARLRLRPSTQLQDMHLDIESRGTPAAGELRDGEVLPAGRTRVAVHVNRVLDVFEPPTRRRLQQMILGLGAGLDDGGDQLRAAFVELAPFVRSAARLTRETARRDRLTRRLVRNTRLLLDELATRERELTGLVVRGGETLEDLGARHDETGELLRRIEPTLATATRAFSALRGSLDSVDPALTALREPARELEGGLQALREFSTRAEPTLRALQPTVKSLTPVARDLPPLGRGLSGAFRSLAPQGEPLDTLTKDVAACQAPIAKFFHQTMSVFKFGDAHGAYPRGETAQGTGSLGGPELGLIRGPSCARRGGG